MRATVATAGADAMDEVLSARFRARLLAFIRRRLGSEADAEDVLQHVLMRFAEQGPSEEAAGPAWVYTAARRAVIDAYRERSHEPLPADPVDVSDESDALAELRGCTAALLEQLAEHDRELLEAVDLRGRSQTELAAELGAPLSTIKSRVQRARARFRDALMGCCGVLLDRRGMPIGADPTGGVRDGCGCASRACGCAD